MQVSRFCLFFCFLAEHNTLILRMDNLSDDRLTRNRWQKLLKGQQKQKVKTQQHMGAENIIQRLNIM